MPEQVAVQVLGALRCTRGGQPLDALGARSAEAALAYLAVQTAPVARESLAHLLWPGLGEEAARASLRTALHRLRRQLGPSLLTTRNHLELATQVRVDAREFEALLRRGETGAAAALYGGEFLAGFSYDGSGEFESWVVDERERLRQLAIAAHEELLAGQLAEGDDEAALASARKLGALEPLHEPALRAEMRLLSAKGRRPAALRSFERFRRLLTSELGLEPDERTLRLADALRSGGAPAVAAPAVAAARARKSEVRGFPAYAIPLVGREEELATLQRRLQDPDCRWLTVVGMGGVGKTRLAVEAARRLHSGYADGALFLPLAGVGSPDHLLEALARRLGVEPAPRLDLTEQLTAHLHRRALLLILDNFEQLAGEAPRVAALLQQAEGVKVLATSRERLHLPGEWLLPLAGLERPEEARRLFSLHAGRLTPDFDGVQETEALDAISAAVGGLPLALELAAGWTNALSPADIAAELERGAVLLTAPDHALPERQRTLVAVFDSSLERLPAGLEGAFARLAPFRGGFTPELAAEVADLELPSLLTLVNRSLLSPAPGGRFELHELLRRHAQARLEAAGEADAVAERHLSAFRRLAERTATEVLGQQPGVWLGRLAAEQDNVRAALDRALMGPEEHAARLLEAMAWFWRLTCALDEGRAWLRRGLAQATAPLARATLHHHLGHLCWMAGQLEEADKELGAGLAELTEAGELDGPRAAQLRCSIAMVRFSQGDQFGAAHLLEEAQGAFREADATWWRAFAHGWRGRVAAATGESARARAEYRRSLDLFERVGSAWGLGLFTQPAAELLLEGGELAAARRLAGRSVTLLSETGFRHSLWSAHRLLARIALAEGDRAAAEGHLQQAVAICRELGDEYQALRLEDELKRVPPRT